MKFLLISGTVAAALIASAATVLRSHTPVADRPASVSAMSLQDIHAAANVNKLPVENFEDRFETWSTAKR
jgi:hypothetical protein